MKYKKIIAKKMLLENFIIIIFSLVATSVFGLKICLFKNDSAAGENGKKRYSFTKNCIAQGEFALKISMASSVIINFAQDT